MEDQDSENDIVELSDHLNGMGAVLFELRRNEEMTDVTFLCELTKVKAHKLVLSACSSYLREVFKDNPSENAFIIIKGINKKDLEAVLQYAYCGKVRLRKNQMSGFLAAAEMLHMPVEYQKIDVEKVLEEVTTSVGPSQMTGSFNPAIINYAEEQADPLDSTQCYTDSIQRPERKNQVSEKVKDKFKGKSSPHAQNSIAQRKRTEKGLRLLREEEPVVMNTSGLLTNNHLEDSYAELMEDTAGFGIETYLTDDHNTMNMYNNDVVIEPNPIMQPIMFPGSDSERLPAVEAVVYENIQCDLPVPHSSMAVTLEQKSSSASTSISKKNLASSVRGVETPTNRKFPALSSGEGSVNAVKPYVDDSVFESEATIDLSSSETSSNVSSVTNRRPYRRGNVAKKSTGGKSVFHRRHFR